ncbi:MAG: hypothetical protein WC028_28085 [Candidatus Obscuribacterales bacterium]|jgi:hypothetical protein
MNEFATHKFPAAINQLVTQLFDLRLSHPATFESLSKHLRRLDLATLVTPVLWSKFPYVRTAMSLDRATLLADVSLRQQVVAVVADNLYCLMRRDYKDSHEVVLKTLTVEHLFWCISTLWVNELTAPAVVDFVLHEAIKESNRDTWLTIDKTIDSIGCH